MAKNDEVSAKRNTLKVFAEKIFILNFLLALIMTGAQFLTESMVRLEGVRHGSTDLVAIKIYSFFIVFVLVMQEAALFVRLNKFLKIQLREEEE